MNTADTLSDSPPRWRATTVLAVRKDGHLALGADGQVSLGNTIVKGNARKIRRLTSGKSITLVGFAGGAADSLTLFERLEGKMESHPGQLARACVELAKDWRTDRYLRRSEAMLVVADAKEMFLLSGSGDMVEPEHGVVGIGSGGNYALAAARALLDSEHPADEVVRRSLAVAADICIYTNHSIHIETLPQ